MKLAIGLFVISIFVSFLLLNPSIKEATTALFLNGSPKVLSQMELDRNGNSYKVVKLGSSRGLTVELYKKTPEGYIKTDSQGLTDKKDAWYKFENEKHNLFLKDINDDGEPEIILPSLDKSMKARLNVFMLDSTQDQLLKVSTH